MNNTDSKSNLCVLGCGGFIGSHLIEKLLKRGGFRIIGIDKNTSKITHLLSDSCFEFISLDIRDIEKVKSFIEKCDTIISLVALCNPSLYNKMPLEVIEINFTLQFEIVKLCAELKKRLIHFSTSEVYGKTLQSLVNTIGDIEIAHYLMHEDTSPLILGPISAQRWTYSCAKQLVERLIYAYSFERGLFYTIVRPFNFIGPKIDFLPGIDGEGIPRVFACFMEALIKGKPLYLVDGGYSKRTFTYIEDAVDAIVKIIEFPDKSQNQIFNIGNPLNEISIVELAKKMLYIFSEIAPKNAHQSYRIESIPSEQFYGKGYEDCDRRVPDISKARTLLHWEPKVDLDTALRNTMKWYVEYYIDALAG